MVEKAAQDYAGIIEGTNFEEQIYPICTTIEDMMFRLDEFETLLSNVKTESKFVMESHVSRIAEFSDTFTELCGRIDTLQQFLDVVNSNVNEIEKSLDIAEDELKVSDYSLKCLILKPLLSRAKASDVIESVKSNLQNEKFQKIAIFKTNENFKEVK